MTAACPAAGQDLEPSLAGRRSRQLEMGLAAFEQGRKQASEMAVTPERCQRRSRPRG